MKCFFKAELNEFLLRRILISLDSNWDQSLGKLEKGNFSAVVSLAGGMKRSLLFLSL